MGTMPVNKLLISMSLPMMASMLVQALYNIVDSIFVSRVCEDALTAVSMAFPIQTLMIAVGVGTGVGVNALLSKSLGEKNYEQANRAATNGLFLNVIGMLVFMVFGLVASRFYYAVQTDSPEIIAYGTWGELLPILAMALLLTRVSLPAAAAVPLATLAVCLGAGCRWPAPSPTSFWTPS